MRKVALGGTFEGSGRFGFGGCERVFREVLLLVSMRRACCGGCCCLLLSSSSLSQSSYRINFRRDA
jgi:hypothetical protein